MKANVTVLSLLLALVCMACSSSATLSSIQASVNHSDKLKLHALVYIPVELSSKHISTRPSSRECLLYTANIEAGTGYVSAVRSGLESAIERVEIVDSMPTEEDARRKGANLLVILYQPREDCLVKVDDLIIESEVYSQFECWFPIQFRSIQGDSIHSFTATAYSSARGYGSCTDLADGMRESMEACLRKAADSIASTTYTAVPIREYEKSVSSH